MTLEELAAWLNETYPDRDWDQQCQRLVWNAVWKLSGVRESQMANYATATAARIASNIVSTDPAAAPVGAIHYWRNPAEGHVGISLGGGRVLMTGTARALGEGGVLLGTNYGVTTVAAYTKARGNPYLGWARTNGANPSIIDKIATPQAVGGLPMFALYWTGPQVNNTRVSGRMITSYGSFWVPSMQIMGLLNRRHDAALKPGDGADNMLDAEHDIINGYLQMCFKSVLTGVTLDPAKLRSALTDALKAAGTNIVVDADTEVPVEDLAKAFEVAAPRIAAAMVKQAGLVMSK